jgi:hypothetical protein
MGNAYLTTASSLWPAKNVVSMGHGTMDNGEDVSASYVASPRPLLSQSTGKPSLHYSTHAKQIGGSINREILKYAASCVEWTNVD